MLGFVKAYIKSMRLYYAFITGIAGWLGIAYYEFTAKQHFEASGNEGFLYKKVIILALLFLSWGINQIFNDFLGIKEDRINAPQRPMVTGELHPKKAVMTSLVLLAASFVIIYLFLEPAAIIPALLGVLLNIVYEYAKGCSILGNLVFGLMIMMCTVVGYLASGPLIKPYASPTGISLLILVCASNGLMTFYTFFKDYKGDMAVKKKTLVVKYGIEKARYIALGAAVIPSVLCIGAFLGGFIETRANNTFVFLMVLTLFLQLWTGFLYFRYPSGEKTYYSLSTNFRACACGQAALIALFNAQLGMMLFIITYILVGFLFNLHSNSKA